MEMCLGDQQFITLLLYLDSIDRMLGHIELVLKWLEEFNLKLRPKKCHFLQHIVVLLGYILSAYDISANLLKVDKGKDLLVPTNPKELQSFLGLALYYHQSIPKFTAISKCLHWSSKPSKSKKVRKINLQQTRIRKPSHGQVNAKRHLTS